MRLPAASVIFVLTSAACGSGNPEVPPAFPPIVVDRLPIQSDLVQRQRSSVDALGVRDPARFMGQIDLADALVILADLHLGAAIASDPKVAALPIPPDRRATSSGEEGDESPKAPLRDEASLAALEPQARAHVDEADRALEEAAERLAAIAASKPAFEVAEVRARRARILDTLGQLTDARDEWYAVVRTPNVEPASKLEGCLAYARFFADNGKEAPLASALSCASEAAGRVTDRAQVAAICARSVFASVSSSLRPTNRNPCTP
jgi:hypothetical protein